MAGSRSLAAYALTMSAAIGLAVTLNAESALGDLQPTDLRDASIDDLLTAGVRLQDGSAHVRQLHIDDGELHAVTLGVGSPSPWLDAVFHSQPVLLAPDELTFSRSTGDIVVRRSAEALITETNQGMPLAQPVAATQMAPSALFGAEVTGGPLTGEVRVVDVIGEHEIERLRTQQVRLNGTPGETHIAMADCAHFSVFARQVDLSACQNRGLEGRG
jgi:hypothetical protein